MRDHSQCPRVELAKRSDAVICGCKIKSNNGPAKQASAGAAGTVKRGDLRENIGGPWKLANAYRYRRRSSSLRASESTDAAGDCVIDLPIRLLVEDKLDLATHRRAITVWLDWHRS